ncbi:MAG: DNA gyrase subunit A [Hyphomicrobiales bacterium]|nr:DNA gyrase subunit A [Hyphomicrobiales bacterium]MCY4032574.1 DNA gyrase subunit A [Hyphomicrobiales bacterium]MCY4037977.1 DNA gyrase subunit A [Hyphomicrobiales bacterium]
MTDKPTTPSSEQIVSIALEEEMRSSYLDYAMSVIVARALPDVRDGLKPVHRRILFSMHENNYAWNKPYRKSARIVGEVMGKYHPHGDQAIYDALARMAQDFSMRLPLLDGQGNFGSVDGDPPAAMRYTEIRMGRSAHALLTDIDKETVDFRDNYDSSEQEPTILPAEFPNLLVNGSGGIAVGMRTNVPPHNLGEVIDACLRLLDNADTSLEELMQLVPGPDFPTGGVVIDQGDRRAPYRTGSGIIRVRGKVEVTTGRGKNPALIITEIPYQVNKSEMLEKISAMASGKQGERRIQGISGMRDESNREGIRVVIELRKDAEPEVVLNQLYRYTPLQNSFSVSMLALNEGRPELMNLKEILEAFLKFRKEVVARRTRFQLRRARERAHILVGLAITVANIDEVVKMIRASANPAEARTKLMARDWPAKQVIDLINLVDDPDYAISKKNTCRLSETQARAILDLRLQRLTALGREEIAEEINELVKKIKQYLSILGDSKKLLKIVRDELSVMREEFATPRRSEVTQIETDFNDEDLIRQEEMVVTVSHRGYIKRVPLSTYRAQKRGGKGRSGMNIKDEDFVERIFSASTHTPMLFFTSRGIVYKMKVWRLPQGAPQSRGKAMVNIFPLEAEESVTSIMELPESDSESVADTDVMFATRLGNVRRNKLKDFIQVHRGGKIAMKLPKDDAIVAVATCEPDEDVMLATAKGRCIRFPVDSIRVFAGRASKGVRGIRLDKDDKVISMSILKHIDATPEERDAFLRQAGKGRGKDESVGEGKVKKLSKQRFEELEALEQFILTASANGFGKRTSSISYLTKNRGGKGIISMELTKRNDEMISSFPITEDDQIMLISNGGQLIRCGIKDVRIAGRNTKGVTLFRLGKGEKVVSVAQVDETDNGGEDDETDVSDTPEPAA